MEDTSKSLELFVEKLVEEKGFESISAEALEEIKKDLMGRVSDRINMTILENMPEEKMAEFSEILDGSSAGEIDEYCRANIPNLDEVIASALLKFRETYLNA